MVFGYDWAGSSTADKRDEINQVDWRSKESVRQSYWFKGYMDSVKAEVKVLCQQHPRSRLRLLCISGGPISQLEVQTIKDSLVEEAEGDLATRGISVLPRVGADGITKERRIEVVEMGFEQFKGLAHHGYKSRAPTAKAQAAGDDAAGAGLLQRAHSD